MKDALMHIILALDGSAESLAATKQLAQLPWKAKPKVTVVTALVDSPYDFVASETGMRLREAERELAIKHFAAAQALLAGHCETIEHVVEHEHPRRLILRVAEEQRADLIALGSRGHSAAYRVVLGSTAEYVANHAKCSVLVVPSAKDPTTPAEQDDDFRILVAYDGSDESKTAYEQMLSLAWPDDRTQIDLALMLERPSLLPDDVVYDPEQIAESEQALAQLKRPAELGCEVTESVGETLHVGRAILVRAENNRSNLLFIGGTGKSAVARFFLGSTSRYVLHHTQGSLWIARTKQWG